MIIMKKNIFLLFLVLSNIIFSQEINVIKKGDFPAGNYMTLNDVLNRKPSSTEEVYYGKYAKEDTLKMPEKTFFYFKATDRKVQDPLGISYNGEMYFQTYNKYTNKKDKGYDPDVYSRFCKVTSYGRFLYFEEDMMGVWARGLLANVSYSHGNGKTRGMVIDFEKKEINIFRDCEDINIFLTEHNLKGFECQSKRLSIEETRKIIEEINKY
jgi:hypothetical protein